jgi:TRAP-type C4-dicarboxylate transport system permease small subunit
MKIMKWLDAHFEEVLLVILTIIMIAATSAQVFMRFIMGSSLIWSEELARYCFIWLVYIGISYGVKKQRHINVDVVLLALNDKGKIILNMFAKLVFLAFAIFVVIYGYGLSMQLLGWGQTSPGLGIPMAYVYMAAPAGMLLTSIRLIQQLYMQIQTLRGKENFTVQTEAEKIVQEKDETLTKTTGLEDSNRRL